ncbi:MAG: D-mannonate epimerase, partial [Bacteroidales bacterium]|nr:D-mannonate epimerase [Bacteroidales bacterium]
MMYFEKGSATTDLTSEDLKNGLYEALEKLGNRQKVLAIPPDFTRYPSH